MTPTRRKYFLFAVFAAITLVLDQWTKVWARAALGPIEGLKVKQVFGDSFYFSYRENPGVAFSMFRDLPGGRYVLAAIATAALAMVFAYLRKTEVEHTRLHVALGFVGGGALGNLIDRVQHGVVTDFIIADLGFWPLNPWPAFNIADAGLCVGVGLMLLDMIRAPRAAVPAGAPPKAPGET